MEVGGNGNSRWIMNGNNWNTDGSGNGNGNERTGILMGGNENEN
jgi:hypothetical protein